jgi:hypothetical protein
MAKLEKYRTCVEQVLKDYSRYKPAYGEIEVQLIFDQQRDHYQLNDVGWKKGVRVFGCILHLDIKDEKIWIQYDGTEDGIADDLMALGVPKEDIVLGFHPAYKRKYTGFAVG